MYLRLAFAVAAHLNAEVVIVDEVLAVGDFEFQEKCMQKLREVTASGRTVLFVSHNLSAVRHLCTRAMLLHCGRVVTSGDPLKVVETYRVSKPISGPIAESATPPDIVAGVDLRLADGSPPTAFLSQRTFWDSQERGDGGEGSELIDMGEFVSEQHHKYYGRPWVLGRYYFDYLVRRGLKPSQKVLDVGCGAGRVGVHLIRYLNEGCYFGVDAHLRSLVAFTAYESFMNNLGEKKPRLLYNATFDLSVFGIRFDAVLDCYVTHHLEWNAAYRAYEAIAAVAAEGARIFVPHAPAIGIKSMQRLGFSLSHVESVFYPLLSFSSDIISTTDKWHEFTYMQRTVSVSVGRPHL
jgi:SAM-dependent methyltransferase